MSVCTWVSIVCVQPLQLLQLSSYNPSPFALQKVAMVTPTQQTRALESKWMRHTETVCSPWTRLSRRLKKTQHKCLQVNWRRQNLNILFCCILIRNLEVKVMIKTTVIFTLICCVAASPQKLRPVCLRVLSAEDSPAPTEHDKSKAKGETKLSPEHQNNMIWTSSSKKKFSFYW